MIVVDTSAFCSLAIADSLAVVLSEYDVHTTDAVIAELKDTAEYDDRHATAAADTLERTSAFSVHSVSDPAFESSRIDAGEGSCVVLARDLEAEFLLTDDLRALPELQNLTDATVAISPILLKALVKRGVLDSREAVDRVETLAERRDWLGAPIYRRAMSLFE